MIDKVQDTQRKVLVERTVLCAICTGRWRVTGVAIATESLRGVTTESFLWFVLV